MYILLADDHAIFRDSLSPFLKTLDDGKGLGSRVEILEAESLEEVLACATAGPVPELILLDLQMPGMKGVSSVETVCKTFPQSAVVILSGYADRTTILAALKVGAKGYVPKTARGRALVTALKVVMAGEIYLPTALLEEPAIAVSPTNSAETSGVLSKLSKSERGILGHLINGKTNKEIARELALEEITIKVHLRNIYRKIDASNRADAVRIALTEGWS